MLYIEFSSTLFKSEAECKQDSVKTKDGTRAGSRSGWTRNSLCLIEVIPATILLEICSKRSVYVTRTTRRVLSNGILRFPATQHMVFGLIHGVRRHLKIIDNLSIPLDRNRQVVLGISMKCLKQVSRRLAANFAYIYIDA